MERWKESQLMQISCTTEIDTAYRISLGFAKNIGFKFFSFSTTYPTKADHFNTAQLNNYPTDWCIEYEQKNFGAIDPVVAHCNHSRLPVLWSEELFSKTPSMWDALEQRGLQYGFSQSIHDEKNGHCSILSLARSHCPMTPYELYENLGFLTFIGYHLHTLIAQTLPKKAAKPSVPNLTPREIAVLNLAAVGKTACESAMILNLSARTVNFHVQSAILKLGVRNKTSAVIAATKVGLLNSSAIR